MTTKSKTTEETDTANAANAANAEEVKAKREAADKAREEANAAQAKADKARAEVADANKSPEQKKADKAAQEADDAQAAAAQAEREAGAGAPRSTVRDARVLAPIDPMMPAGHHMAQKFGNDPANPKAAHANHDLPEQKTVRLHRITPDSKEPVRTSCHPDMTGDYLRAGWSLDVDQPGTPVLTEAERAERDEREREAAKA